MLRSRVIRLGQVVASALLLVVLFQNCSQPPSNLRDKNFAKGTESGRKFGIRSNGEGYEGKVQTSFLNFSDHCQTSNSPSNVVELREDGLYQVIENCSEIIPRVLTKKVPTPHNPESLVIGERLYDEQDAFRSTMFCRGQEVDPVNPSLTIVGDVKIYETADGTFAKVFIGKYDGDSSLVHEYRREDLPISVSQQGIQLAYEVSDDDLLSLYIHPYTMQANIFTVKRAQAQGGTSLDSGSSFDQLFASIRRMNCWRN